MPRSHQDAALQQAPSGAPRPRALRRELIAAAVWVYVPTLVAILALVVVATTADIPLRRFFVDPVDELGAPMYIGLVSNVGVLLWASAASVCLLAASVLRQSPNSRERVRFLQSAGLITALLTIDDLFLLHEEALPERLNVPQPTVMIGYGILLAWFTVRFRQSILGSDYAFLIAAGAFFAVSLIVDLFVESEFFFGDLAGQHLIEDGFKLLGIVGWSTYFWRSSMQSLGSRV